MGMLKCVDWNALDANIFGAVIGTGWMIWNLRKGANTINLPENTGLAHPEGALAFKFCPVSIDLFATCAVACGMPQVSKLIKVFPNAYTQGIHDLT